MNASNLTLAAALAALFAVPAVAADVDLTLQPVRCGIETQPEVFDGTGRIPLLSSNVEVTEHCAVKAEVGSFNGGCREVGPFLWLHPYIHLESDCDLVVRY